jgi:hypothetical protein
MEHRWGWRVSMDELARVSDERGPVSAARLRDLSTSGAFLEIAPEFVPLSFVEVQFAIERRGRRLVESVPAHVVRVTPEGIGVEWNEFNPPAVARLLHARLELQGPVDSTIGIRNGANAL